jgi:hypothetical protein
MKVSTLVLCSLLLPGLVYASGLQTRSYEIGNVRHIEANNAVVVELRQAREPSISAEAEADVLPRVVVDVKGDRVTLGVKGEKRRVRVVRWQ